MRKQRRNLKQIYTHRVRGPGWDLSNDEVVWLMKRARVLANEA